MAETGNKDIFWMMYASVWSFHKKFINGVCDDDEFWEKAASEANEIARKYNGSKFIVGLLVNELKEMERICKARKQDAKAAGG